MVKSNWSKSELGQQTVNRSKKITLNTSGWPIVCRRSVIFPKFKVQVKMTNFKSILFNISWQSFGKSLTVTNRETIFPKYFQSGSFVCSSGHFWGIISNTIVLKYSIFYFELEIRDFLICKLNLYHQ